MCEVGKGFYWWLRMAIGKVEIVFNLSNPCSLGSVRFERLGSITATCQVGQSLWESDLTG